MTTDPSAKEKIIVPLDVPGAAEAVRLVRDLTGLITFYKIGLELFTPLRSRHRGPSPGRGGR